MTLKPRLCALWPLALIACATSSPSSPVAPAQNGDDASGGSSSSSGGGSGSSSSSSGGGSSSGTGTVTDAAASGGDDSATSGSEGAAPSADDGGASGGDASTDGAASGGPDAGSGDGGACAGLFCEDFEQGQGQLDPAKWDLETGGGGTSMVQQQTVGHGKYAWYVHGTGSVGGFATIMTKNAPMALQGAGPVFGRAYIYAAANFGAHVQLGFAGTTRDPTVAPMIMTNGVNFNYMEFAEFSNSWQLGFDLFAPAPTVAKGFVEEASYPPAHDMYPTMTWNCIEWEFGDNPDMMLLWVDGKQIDQFDAQHINYSSTTTTPGSVLNGMSSNIIGGFAVFGFGFHSWGSSTAVDRYYDDIVLDIKRVNCLP